MMGSFWLVCFPEDAAMSSRISAPNVAGSERSEVIRERERDRQTEGKEEERQSVLSLLLSQYKPPFYSTLYKSCPILVPVTSEYHPAAGIAPPPEEQLLGKPPRERGISAEHHLRPRAELSHHVDRYIHTFERERRKESDIITT
jgi:hypothetical protein